MHGATWVETRKPAAVDAEVHELIRERWSPRAFSEEAVGSGEVRKLVEAARWAPSSMNEQPWSFIVADRATNPGAHERVVSTLMAANAVWARRAPLLVVAVARLAYQRNGAPNRHALYDTGQAVALLSVEATELGLRVHQMGGFDVAKAREVLGIPEGEEPVAVLAIGYPGAPAELSEELRVREAAPRQRRPVGEWVFDGAWGKSAGH